jgi:hypothetical protein
VSEFESEEYMENARKERVLVLKVAYTVLLLPLKVTYSSQACFYKLSTYSGTFEWQIYHSFYLVVKYKYLDWDNLCFSSCLLKFSHLNQAFE